MSISIQHCKLSEFFIREFLILFCIHREPGQQKLIKTTTFHQSGEKRVARELLYDPPGTEVVRHSRTRHRSPGGWENRTVDFVDSGTVERHQSPNVRSEHFYTESKDLTHLPKSPKVHYSEHVSESVGADAVRKLDIDNHLLPSPNTKVTTTVRTYTYELPEEPETGLINKKIHMKDEAYNRTTTTLPSNRAERDIPREIELLPPGASHTLTTYRQDANDYPTVVNGLPASTNSKSMFYKKESKSSNTTYYPGSPDPSLLPRLTQTDDGTGRPVHVYQEQITHKGPPGGPVPSDPYGMNTITYRYNSTNTNANVRYPPPEREPLLPAFPVDGVDNRHPDANPPKRVEDLMATFGDVSLKKIKNFSFLTIFFYLRPPSLKQTTYADEKLLKSQLLQRVSRKSNVLWCQFKITMSHNVSPHAILLDLPSTIRQAMKCLKRKRKLLSGKQA